MLVHDFIRGAAQRHGDKTSIIFSNETYSFKAIDDSSDRLALALQRLGLARGDRVAVVLDNSAEMVIVVWGVLKAGAVAVLASPGKKPQEIGFILGDSDAACLFAHTELRSQINAATALASFTGLLIWVGASVQAGEASLNEILAQAHSEPADADLIDQDLSFIIYTSGSTGRPKGVMMTHQNIVNNIVSISAYLQNGPDDVILCVLPLSHSYGLFQILDGAQIGYTVVLERSFAFPHEVLKRIGEQRVTGMAGIPTIFATILEHAQRKGFDLSSLRYLTNAAAALPPAHVRELRRLLPEVKLFLMYGLTECTRVSYLDPSRVDEKPTSVGRAMPNSASYIVDETGRRCGPDEIGELVIRGANVMRGYWRRPDESAAALRDGDIPGEKVLYTGDLFWKDEEGILYFVGRRDDVFKCRGEKISPRHVEACLHDLGGVAEAAVVGVPHPTDGYAIKAYVVARAGYQLSDQQLRKHCRAHLDALFVPRYFELCDCLPKTESGKIMRSALRNS